MNNVAVEQRGSVWAWMRLRLFSSPLNALLTFLIAWILWKLVPPALSWTFFDATWVGSKSADCNGEGACWVFVQQRFMQFIFGFYPQGERWRVVVALAPLFVAPVLFWMRRFPWKLPLAIFMGLVYPLLAGFLLHGQAFGLPVVNTDKWGGLMLTLIISAVGISLSLPLGVLLALGRRSTMPVISRLCVLFIELWRGVPLITVLFMASVMLPLFLPAGVNFDKLLRALIGVTLFSSAYMAEVVRGGLAALPKGQYEAAAALGLGYWRMMGLVILPQALRLVIPGIVNTFIGLFKDTSLVLVIGMFDLLGMVQAASTDPEWLGHAIEGYVFAGFVYWVFCFIMSRLSARLEMQLGRQEQQLGKEAHA